MNPVLFCIGAAKAGTSWLHTQLAAHPGCHFRAIKELHYFDALDTGRLDRQIENHERQQLALTARLAAQGKVPNEDQGRRLADRADWLDVLGLGREDEQAYLDYLRRGAEPGQLVGDVTPAYALLSEERLAQMAKIAPDTKILYVLRDPVERLWSHVRMIAARRDPEGKVTPRRTGNILRRVFRGEETQIVDRSDYASTFAKLARAVPGRQTMIAVFEDMVAGSELARIFEFLGLAQAEPLLAPVHAGQALAMTAHQRQAATEWLQPQYDAAAEVFGRMPSAWRGKGTW